MVVAVVAVSAVTPEDDQNARRDAAGAVVAVSAVTPEDNQNALRRLLLLFVAFELSSGHAFSRCMLF